MGLAPDIKKYLQKKHQDISKSGAYYGIDKFYRSIIKDGKYSISRKDIQLFLQSQEYYTLQQQVNRKFKRPKVIVPYKGYQLDIDTAHLTEYRDKNDSYSYILGAIDCFSKEAHAIPLKSLKSKDVVPELKNLIAKFDKVERIRTDMGSEFKSARAQSLFKQLKIKHFYAKNTEIKANIIERFFKTLKTLIFRFMVSKNTHRWVDELSNIVKTYNLSFHNSIKQSPASVKEADEYKIWKELYYKKSYGPEHNFTFNFNIHDTVRISIIKAPFERIFDEKWTREYFIVSDRFYKESIPVYELKDIQNDAVGGVFYNNELQKIDVKDSDDTYIIEKI